MTGLELFGRYLFDMTIKKYTTSLDGLVIENPVKSFFDYCIERENIRLKREKGEIFPWSDDEIFQKGKRLNFNSNNAGGILGGISSGQEIIASFAVKPTSSILTTRKTINKFGKNTTISVKGRHDPCVGIRAVPVGEAMINCVLLDHYLMNKAQCS